MGIAAIGGGVGFDEAADIACRGRGTFDGEIGTELEKELEGGWWEIHGTVAGPAGGAAKLGILFRLEPWDLRELVLERPQFFFVVKFGES